MSLLSKSLIFCAISLCSLARGNEPFPFVDKAGQQARDVDRRAILDSELGAEQQALAAAHESMAKAATDDARTDLHRHEENVKALQRELARLPKAKPVRVAAQVAGSDPAAVNKHNTFAPAQAPFWDVYRRSTPPTDFQPPAKELP